VTPEHVQEGEEEEEERVSSVSIYLHNRIAWFISPSIRCPSTVLKEDCECTVMNSCSRRCLRYQCATGSSSRSVVTFPPEERRARLHLRSLLLLSTRLSAGFSVSLVAVMATSCYPSEPSEPQVDSLIAEVILCFVHPYIHTIPSIIHVD